MSNRHSGQYNFKWDEWMICENCQHLNKPNATSCALGCGKQHIHVEDTRNIITSKDGINACPYCNLLYAGLVTICKRCNQPLQSIVDRPNFYRYELPKYNEIVSCPKCSGTKLQTPFCDHCGGMVQLRLSYTTIRPTAQITLRNGDRSLSCDVLFDSGATHNVFHGYLAKAIGLDLSHAPTTVFGNVVISHTLSYRADIEIALKEKYYLVPVYFTDDLPKDFENMLGVVGFFDRFDFHNSGKTVVLEEKDVLKVKYYRFCPACGQEGGYLYSNYCASCGASLRVPGKYLE